MSINGRKIALALTADGEIDLIREMVNLLRPYIDRVVICEGTRTFDGHVRETLGPQWREILELEPEQFRYVIQDLPVNGDSIADARKRELVQRAGLALAVRDMDPNDLMLAVDADEFVDPEWLLAHAGEIDSVTRLRMFPLYGSLNRRAPDWHCCLKHITIPLNQWPPAETGWLYDGAVLGPIGLLEGRGVGHWRSEPDRMSAESAGWHLLHILPANEDLSFKISRQGHEWQGVTEQSFVTKCVNAGVHRSGWWAATECAIPEALQPLAAKYPETVMGPFPADLYRQELMAEAYELFQRLEADVPKTS